MCRNGVDLVKLVVAPWPRAYGLRVEPDRLARLPLFAALSVDERAGIADLVDEIFVPAGRQLASEGEFAYHLFVIEEGTASVLVGDSPVRELGPGDVFGEVGLLVTGRRTATVVATTPMTLATIFDASYRRLERELPAVAASLRRVAGERLAQSSSSSSTRSGRR
jgi:CRP-like cAMP-binding protein